MKTSEMLTLAMAFVAGAGGAMAQERTPLTQDRSPISVKKTIDHCFNCHGYQGRNTGSIVPAPQLAGLQAGYIEQELKKFRDRTRGDPYAVAYMWGTAQTFTDAKIKELGAYFAAQAPISGTSQDPAAVAAGRKIFAEGVPSTGVPPCFGCHGEKALGNETAPPVPRLASQHREYLADQLLFFKTGQRASDIMHGIAGNMTDEQIQQVAAYLASL